MGHEALVHGLIEAATWTPERYRELQDRNAVVLAGLPEHDNWPALVRGLFALPAAYPEGTYRTQVIHFGASFKNEPDDLRFWDPWLDKFEVLLRQLYWWSATAHLEREGWPPVTIEWSPTENALMALTGEVPEPVGDWTRI